MAYSVVPGLAGMGLVPAALCGAMARRYASLIEFQRRFPDEVSCALFVFERRWPDGFTCPACGGTRSWPLKSRAYTCECIACGQQTSVTAGTIMHRTKLPLTTWFWAAHLMATHSNGMSAQQLMGQLGLCSYKTAWLLAQKLRRSIPTAIRWRVWSRWTRPRCHCAPTTTLRLRPVRSSSSVPLK